MNKKLAFGMSVMVLSSLTGCDKPQTSAKPQASTPELLLNPPAFYVAVDGLSRTDDHFKTNAFKPMANHCWEYTTVRKCMALYAKEGDGSHGSSADIGGFFAEYSYATKKWEVKAETLAFTQNGAWGEAPTPNFVMLGPDKYGFVMTTSFTQGGYAEEHLSLYGVSGKGFVEMLQMPSHYDNGATGEEDQSKLYNVQVMLSEDIDNTQDYYPPKAKLVVDGKYDVASDEQLSKLFGKATEIRLIYKDGQYVVEGQGGKS